MWVRARVSTRRRDTPANDQNGGQPPPHRGHGHITLTHAHANSYSSPYVECGGRGQKGDGHGGVRAQHGIQQGDCAGTRGPRVRGKFPIILQHPRGMRRTGAGGGGEGPSIQSTRHRTAGCARGGQRDAGPCGAPQTFLQPQCYSQGGGEGRGGEANLDRVKNNPPGMFLG